MSSPSLPRCAIYARYSSELQRAASIEDQLRVCQERARREGWAVVGSFTDAASSGATALRPGYQALLAALRAGSVDLVLAESLDRLSRDQEHVAGFFKQARFAGVRVVTLAEGEISELQVGLKGTMGALYLRDLAAKTRRGLEGRVRQGRSGGGLCYGYRVIRGGPVGRDGEPERGLRAIDPAQAAVVRRIFAEFAAGSSPIAVARRLNTEGVPGPRGGAWCDGAIRGDARRGVGILRNELYVGRLVWNRRRWLKDPATGNRLARTNGADEFVVAEVPELRIVTQDLWERVQVRLAAQRRHHRAAGEGVGDAAAEGDRRAGEGPLWEKRQPRHLLTAKVYCGGCGGRFAAVGRDYLACKAAVRHAAGCANRARVRRSRLEAEVLEALGSRLMQPELVREFAAAFTAEWNRLLTEASAGVEAKRRELEAVRRKLAGLVEAIADGLRAPGLQGRLDELEARRTALEAEIAAADQAPAPPRLHPNLPEVYRAMVARLREALEVDGPAGTEALEAARALVARVEVRPPVGAGGAPRIELIGAITAMLSAAGVIAGANAKTPAAGAAAGVAEMLPLVVRRCSESGDAGTRNRRSHHLTVCV